jgi:hypothetical protein
VNENIDGDAEPCHDAVADPEDPARNLNLLGEADIYAPIATAASSVHHRPTTAPKSKPPTMRAGRTMLL